MRDLAYSLPPDSRLIFLTAHRHVRTFAHASSSSLSGQIASFQFMRLPSKRQYPDYYALIKHPIALDDIKSKLESREYASLQDVLQDLETCFRNAKRYNMKDSQIFKDAKFLHVSAIAQSTSHCSTPSTVASHSRLSRNYLLKSTIESQATVTRVRKMKRRRRPHQPIDF